MPYRVRVYVHRRVTRLDVASRRVSRVSCSAGLHSSFSFRFEHSCILDYNLNATHTGRTARNKNTQAKAMAKPKGCGRAPSAVVPVRTEAKWALRLLAPASPLHARSRRAFLALGLASNAKPCPCTYLRLPV